MPIPYQLNQLLDDRNRALYEEVAAAVNVRLEPSDDSGWGSKLENHDGIVYCSESKYPIACFSHELLQLKFESNGMELPYSKTDHDDFPEDAIGFFHNQLVHHKIYAPFITLGFQPQEFLNDDDAKGTKKKLKRDLAMVESLYNKTKQPIGGMLVALPFFVVASPHDSSESTKQFRERLRKCSRPDVFCALEKILSDWMKNPNPDCSQPLAQIFKVAGYPRVGFSRSGTEYDIVYAANVTI